MKKNFIIPLFTLSMFISCTTQKNENPFFSHYDTPFGVPPFEKIDTSHYKPAFIKGMEEQNAEIQAIISNPENPTFENTIEALDNSGALLSKTELVFFNLTQAETNDALQRIAKEISPLLTEHSDNIYLNDSLFARIKYIHDQKDNETLTEEQSRLLDKYYRNFVRSGALLSPENKEKLKEINKELNLLSLHFGDNLLAETNAFELIIDNEADLAGLPDGVKNAAAEEATHRGKPGKWIFTLHDPSRIPFLQYADNRDLREKLYKAYINRCDHDNQYDNKANIAKIVNLRTQKAHLLGFNSYAEFVLDDRMAKTPEAVNALLEKVWSYALPKAKEEAQMLQEIIDKEGGNFKLAAWDWWYYSEKARKSKYALDEESLKPYFLLENVRQGAFTVANRLYGITFEKLENMPVYHPDVEAYEVKDADGSHLGIFYADNFPRPGKSGGAWMSNFREQAIQEGNNIRPVIVNVCNFTKPTSQTPSLLTIDEVQTLFHEFGHALHGMLSQCHYQSMSGTNVARDFVELPSQIMEHWATHPDVLKLYAKHYKTGEIIPDSLIEKMKKSRTFNQGFITTEFVAAGIMDMRWHEVTEEQDFDVRAFEANAVKEMGLIDEIALRYRSPYFAHIFDGGYAVGYYGYLWAEVLDADAFDAFEKNGIFDAQTAQAFRSNILEKGDSQDPMKLYRQFRGTDPNPESLLRNRGLISETTK